MMKLIACISCGIALLTGTYIGIGLAGCEPDASVEYENNNTYWCEMYDDGRVTIHTMQEYLTNDEDENLVIVIDDKR